MLCLSHCFEIITCTLVSVMVGKLRNIYKGLILLEATSRFSQTSNLGWVKSSLAKMAALSYLTELMKNYFPKGCDKDIRGTFLFVKRDIDEFIVPKEVTIICFANNLTAVIVLVNILKENFTSRWEAI